LARQSVGTLGLWFFGASASAPTTVLVAGVGTTIGGTGPGGVAAGYLVLAVGLSLLTVGYVAANGYLRHTAPFLAVPAHGLGRAIGLGTGLLAVAAYFALQLALYGYAGATLAAWWGGPRWWPWWSVLAVLVLGVLGLLRVDLVARALAVALVGELVMIVGIILVGLLDPAGGQVSLAGLSLAPLFTGDAGSKFALTIAGFIGYDIAAAYMEEARSPRAVRRAVFGALWTLGPLFAVATLAVIAAVGAGQAQAAFLGDPVLPLTILADRLGLFAPQVLVLGQGLLLTSLAGAALSFAGSVNRYVYAMARERLLPRALQRTVGSAGALRDAPVAASVTQTLLMVVAVLVFAVAGADPIRVVFTWPAAGAAFAVMTLLVLASVASIRFLARHRETESAWIRMVLPGLGIPAGAGLLWVMIARMHTLLGAPQPSSFTTWMIPGLIAAVLCAGLVWAGLLFVVRREVFAGIGRGRPHPLASPERRYAGMKL
jgi:amino acid transporter